jgi:HlyD family secretion protein
MAPKRKKQFIAAAFSMALIAAGVYIWQAGQRAAGAAAGLVSGNGRIEATDIDVAAKLGGRIQDILVHEGEFVSAGQPLAHIQVQILEAERDEARARRRQAVTAVASAQAEVAVREGDRQAALAMIGQRESERDAAQRRLARSETLTREGAASEQELDDDRARLQSAQATVTAARAQAAAAEAAVTAARTQVAGAHAAVAAADATISRIAADIEDSTLTSPRDGRVQYQIAQAGEVIGNGGKILNLVDLSDVYMIFFVPETAAGRIAMGTEVRIVLDAAPHFVIPAKVSFVADTAQFTPKTVETASERQKLMFRVKAQIDRELLRKNLRLVKTGLPGVAWVRIDPRVPWPAELAVQVPQ